MAPTEEPLKRIKRKYLLLKQYVEFVENQLISV